MRDLRDAVRVRMTGYADGRWAKNDLLAVLITYGGSVLPTRAMDHYVRPRSYETIIRKLKDQHAVVIAGPSLTERFRRRDTGHIDLKVTFEDPKAYNRTWTLPVDLDLMPDGELIEYVCEDRDKPHLVGKRDEA